MQKQLNKSSFTRKEFMRISWIILLLPIIWLWYSMVRRQRSASPLLSEIRLPANITLGISFFDRIIAIKGSGNIVFLPSRCTHLGCQIRSAENNELVCPCHGSRFGMDGRNLMGPASQPLAWLPYRIDKKTGEFIVKIPTE
jgi:Rieske Fe-S protein